MKPHSDFPIRFLAKLRVKPQPLSQPVPMQTGNKRKNQEKRKDKEKQRTRQQLIKNVPPWPLLRPEPPCQPHPRTRQTV